MKKLLAITMLATSALASVSVHAANLTMTCTNPSEDYVVSFDATARTLGETGWNRDTSRNETTMYTVLAIESSAGRLLVTGLTVNDGPTFRAQFRPGKKIELFAGNKLFETDVCR